MESRTPSAALIRWRRRAAYRKVRTVEQPDPQQLERLCHEDAGSRDLLARFRALAAAQGVQTDNFLAVWAQSILNDCHHIKRH